MWNTLYRETPMPTASPPRLAILSTSLSAKSRSRNVCTYAYNLARERRFEVQMVDLRDYRVLPYGMEGSEGLETLEAEIDRADAFLIGFPLYNYNMNATLKALIERFGKRMENKVVGLITAAGGRSSYMSVMSIAASLMLDFRTWIVPRFVYVNRDDFEEGRVVNEEILRRVEQLLETTYRTAWQHMLPLPER